MAAPKGNQFWKLQSKYGRDKLYSSPELLWDAACEYFQWCDDNPWVKIETTTKGTDKEGNPKEESKTIPTARPYTIEGFCLYCGSSRDWWNKFRQAKHKAFLGVVARIDQTIYRQKFEGAAVGAFNASIIARDLGLSEKTELTGKEGKDLFPQLDPEEVAKLTEIMGK